MRRDPLKFAVEEVVEVPLAAVGQYSDVSLIHRDGAMLDVPRQLTFRVDEDVSGSEMAFDLQDRHARFHIDPAAGTGPPPTDAPHERNRRGVLPGTDTSLLVAAAGVWRSLNARGLSSRGYNVIEA